MELIRMVFDFEFLFLKCKRVHLQPTENLIYLHYHHGANSLVFMSVQCSCERERERGAGRLALRFQRSRANQILWTLEKSRLNIYLFVT